ncbi:hypothetical protein AB1Y20_000387 [Prymnesium parvum]|uniref:FH2 domain-containing protein n=1 Tax=Prymnesium parvum TaxID=97485 RepID=A0AB34K4Q9_PRYPA
MWLDASSWLADDSSPELPVATPLPHAALFSATAAHMLTMDYLELLDAASLHRKGVVLFDCCEGTHRRVHSLAELELNRPYRSVRGIAVRRASRSRVLLDEKVELTHEDLDMFGDPPAALGSDDAAADAGLTPTISSALHYVRLLQAEPARESLQELEGALRSLPDAEDGWLESFVALDGVHALLDVLSFSLSHTAQRAEEVAVQAQCVSCLALLVAHRAPLESLVAQPHAVTCVVAAISVPDPTARPQLAHILLRLALLPCGTHLLLRACAALCDAEAEEKPLEKLVEMVFAASTSVECQAALLRLFFLMLTGPAGEALRGEVREQLEHLELLPKARRHKLDAEPRLEHLLSQLREAIESTGDGGGQRGGSGTHGGGGMREGGGGAEWGDFVHVLRVALDHPAMREAADALRQLASLDDEAIGRAWRQALAGPADSTEAPPASAPPKDDPTPPPPPPPAPPPPPPPPPPQKPPAPPPCGASAASAAPPPRLRALHWRKLSAAVAHADGSVWRDVAATGAEQVDEDELLALFAAQTAASRRRAPPLRAPPPTPPRQLAHPLSLLPPKRAQHVQITLSRFRSARDARAICRAVLTLDLAVLHADDLPALLSCLPTDEEAAALHCLPHPPPLLAEADEFHRLMLRIPRARQRISACLGARHAEASALQRTLEAVAKGPAPPSASQSPRPLRMMNRGTARGDAHGFDLEVLRSLMAIKRPARPASDGADVTLMHYLCVLLGRRGLDSGILRCEMRRVVDAACTDLEEAAREVGRVEADAKALAVEVALADEERGELDEPGAGEAEPPPLEAEDVDLEAVKAFAAARFYAALHGSVHTCAARARCLRAKLEGAREELKHVAVCFGGGAAEADEQLGRAQLAAIADFIASLEKAERDNRRESKLNDTLRKLRHARGQYLSRAAMLPLMNKRTYSEPPHSSPVACPDRALVLDPRSPSSPPAAEESAQHPALGLSTMPHCRRSMSQPMVKTPLKVDSCARGVSANMPSLSNPTYDSDGEYF